MRSRHFAAVAVGTLALAVGSVAQAASDTTEPADDTAEATEPVEGTEAVEETDAEAAEPGAITVGSADFPESQLLAQIYGQALEAAGFEVSYEMGIGARELYYGAVESGEVDLVPEYTGSLLSFILAPEQPEATNVEEQVEALDEALPEDLEVLTPSEAEDKDVIVCRAEVAEELGLAALSDLFAAEETITIGAPPEFETRSPFGLVGFEEIYGAESIDFVPLSIPDVVAALEGGQIDCGNLFSTMSAMQSEDIVALEDDVDVVPNEAVLPLVRSEVATPELVEVLDAINAELDTELLTDLLAQVEVDQLGADVVAAEWLASLEAEETDGTDEVEEAEDEESEDTDADDDMDDDESMDDEEDTEDTDG